VIVREEVPGVMRWENVCTKAPHNVIVIVFGVGSDYNVARCRDHNYTTRAAHRVLVKTEHCPSLKPCQDAKLMTETHDGRDCFLAVPIVVLFTWKAISKCQKKH
jgi:hypothetical protein